MTDATEDPAEAAAPARPHVGSGPSARRPLFGWVGQSVGVWPFLLFTGVFLIWPTLYIVLAAFRDGAGGFTLDNVWGLNTPSIRRGYLASIRVSAISAAIGCVAGFLIAAAVTRGGLPKWIRSPLLTFSGVASNFAGVPLAFAFIALIGPAGLVTLWLQRELGINLRAGLWRMPEGSVWAGWFGDAIPLPRFNLLTETGLIITYLFFQIPLMILIVTPALDGLKREWREAAEVLGATGAQYWRMVAFPILLPTLLGTFALLFANAFGAVATAYALAGPQLNLAPIQLFAQIRGDVLGNPGLGYALATGMILITGLTNGLYIWLRARTERWLK